jgi:hypothetical protein
MSISKELFLSILSMDAYNRGYGAGVSDPSAEDDTGLGVTNSQETYFIGGARIVADSSILVDANGNRLDQSAGFYSISYKMVAGEEIAGLSVGDTIISYRGTDNPDPLTWGDGASDVWQGWITGAGIPGSQSLLALDCNGTRRSRSATDEPEHRRLRLATTWD